MIGLRGAEPRISRQHGQLFLVLFAAAGFLLVMISLVPELVSGDPILPESWDAGVDLCVFVAIGVLLLRRPSPMDGAVHRVLVYGVLAALAMVVFASTVVIVTAVLDVHGGLPIGMAAALGAALVALPVRAFVQRRADAILVGDSTDPYGVIAGLGRRLETTALPDAVLPGVVDTVARALRLPYVAIELESESDSGPVIAASTGRLDGAPVRLPLTYQARRVGWLVLGTRPPRQRLSAANRRLLEDLARQIGVAARAVQLMRDLRRSHALLVAAREEERRRLRRDLHDGLGPMMAGIDLAAQAARNLVARDPTAADSVLERIVDESRAATAEVRRLVYDLRPPVLDQLGLVGALRDQARRLHPPRDDTTDEHLVVAIEAPSDLSGLPPAVAIAAYRIALEALMNVARHANARSCTIRLSLDDGLPPDLCRGVGMVSMEERASELGGTCTIARATGRGTEVHARLPIVALAV